MAESGRLRADGFGGFQIHPTPPPRLPAVELSPGRQVAEAVFGNDRGGSLEECDVQEPPEHHPNTTRTPAWQESCDAESAWVYGDTNRLPGGTFRPLIEHLALDVRIETGARGAP